MSKKIKMILNALSGVQVERASIVGRPANMEPFRIIKNQKHGRSVNLAKLRDKMFSKAEEPEGTAPPVIAAVLTKNEALPAVRDLVGADNIIKEVTVDDGVIVYLTDVELAESDYLRIDAHTAVAVPGIHKYFNERPDTSDFGAHVAVGGFYPSVEMACEALQRVIFRAMENAEPGTPPTAEVDAATQAFAAYVTGLLTAVPVEAFKFEGLVPEQAPTPVYKTEDVAQVQKAITESVARATAAITSLTEALSGYAKAEDLVTLTEEVKKLKGTTSAVPVDDAPPVSKNNNKGIFDDAIRLPGFDE